MLAKGEIFASSLCRALRLWVCFLLRGRAVKPPGASRLVQIAQGQHLHGLHQADVYKRQGYTRDYDLTSGGEGLYLTGGTWQKIRWEKGTAAQAFTFYNEAGQELTVNPGKSYIALYGGFDGQSVMVKGGDEKLNPLNAMEPLPTPCLLYTSRCV